MSLSPLMALSPLDGRYADKTQMLRPIFSEYALMQQRVLIEIQWLILLSEHVDIPEIPALDADALAFLNAIAEQFTLDDAEKIKTIERTTQHDMKAVEYFIKEKMQGHPALHKISEFVHFACTSEDINNLAYARMLKIARQDSLLPLMHALITRLTQLAHEYAAVPMLGHTHGQAATPTTVGKEFATLSVRLQRQYTLFCQLPLYGKINGAVGNFNAHYAAYPNIDWPSLAQQFVESLDLQWNAYTTQIEPHDYIAEYCHILIRFNTILIDMNRDIWGYIALGYFKQKPRAGEIGSSTMPHKINPIDFENAEGNLGLANAIATYLASHLPISRWQRDLVDSTLLRNLSVVLGHATIAYHASLQGLDKLLIDETSLQHDLDANWAILAEPIQTIMRRYGIEQPYEQLKNLTRGKAITQTSLHQFIDTLTLPDAVKKTLRELTPSNYLGKAIELATHIPNPDKNR